jgi:hypothetical protein
MDKKERLQKAIEAQRRKKEREAVRDLTAKGFKRVQILSDLFVNECGAVYSLTKGKELSRDKRNTVNVDGKRVNVAKLLLSAFSGEPMRENSHIMYIDGDSSNLSPQNVKYPQLYTNKDKTDVNPDQLREVIRCYIEVPQKYNVKNQVLTRMYLTEIIRKRAFYTVYSAESGINVFKSYMQGYTKNRTETAKEHGISVRDCGIIVNSFINTLITDIITDLETGKLTKQDYRPRPKTKTQIIREVNEYITAHGGKPAPLRRKSQREILRDFQKYTNELINKAGENGNDKV